MKEKKFWKPMKADNSAVVIEKPRISKTPVTGSNKGITISRFKGLGEMNREQLGLRLESGNPDN
ncbi:MAG: hypothetical protein IPH77_00020 [Ignavibacteria bacterium]|nr:hypothetical protein [Ignavibacteria bacterium]